MTPKEKAENLIEKFIPHTRVFHETLGWEDYYDSAKQCALIAIDEILSFIEDDRFGFSWKDYYLEVKQEIEKL